MRHLFMAFVLIVGALLTTATLSAVLQNWATAARASSATYEPPPIQTSPNSLQTPKPGVDTSKLAPRNR